MPRTGSTPSAAQSRRVTSYDVARAAGVSQSAVSRCFSDHASIAPDARTKVLAAARRLGYQPDALARSLITRRSGLIGFAVTNATLRHSPDIVHALCDRLRADGLLPLLTTLDEEADLAEVFPRLLSYRPEAIVSLAAVDVGSLGSARRAGVPVALVNRAAPPGEATVSVRCDHAAAVATLTRRLVAAGHRRLAFIAGPERAPVSDERCAGFRASLSAAGLDAKAIVHGAYSYEAGHTAALALCGEADRPDALVCANDAIAIGALDACRHVLGLSVPADLSITGFDDIAESGHPTRDLTTVRQPTAAIAERVAAALAACRDDPDLVAAGDHLIAGDICMRGSARMAP
jgi:DNA-binding LacI/PurR family transcriptional regulator